MNKISPGAYRRICWHCGEPFLGRKNAVYCSKKCRESDVKLRLKEIRATTRKKRAARQAKLQADREDIEEILLGMPSILDPSKWIGYTPPPMLCSAWSGNYLPDEWRVERWLRKKTNLYVIFARSAARAKIGISIEPDKRLSKLKSTSPVDLEMLAVLPDIHPYYEGALHKEFSDVRHHGEWFDMCPKLQSLVEKINGCTA